MAEERFYSLGRYLKNVFDERVHRIPVMVPPSEGPYVLCAGAGLDFHHEGAVNTDVRHQMADAKERVRQRFKLGKFMAGLHTSPGASVSMDAIGAAVEAVLTDNEMIGLSVTIRPDCLTGEMLSFLRKTSKTIFTWVEPGLHTIHSETLSRMGFVHSYPAAREAMMSLNNTNIHVAPHIIFGLPGETGEMMKETIEEMALLGAAGMNIHNFFIMRNGQFQSEYESGGLKLLERDEYAGHVCDLIEMLPPSTVLHGILDSVPEERLLAPGWMLARKDNLEYIAAQLEKRGSVQGSGRDKFHQLVGSAVASGDTADLGEGGLAASTVPADGAAADVPVANSPVQEAPEKSG